MGIEAGNCSARANCQSEHAFDLWQYILRISRNRRTFGHDRMPLSSLPEEQACTSALASSYYAEKGAEKFLLIVGGGSVGEPFWLQGPI